MNTDNLSVLGLTIDYGPYGWIDDFDLDWTPNTTDAHGRRYRFGHQAQIAYWNCGQLANALAPVFASTAPLYAGLERYIASYQQAERANVAAKLGLAECVDDDVALIQQLYALLQSAEVDMHAGDEQYAADELGREGHVAESAGQTERLEELRSPWQRKYEVLEQCVGDEHRAERYAKQQRGDGGVA